MTYGALARDLGLRMGELTTALEALMEDDARRNAPLRAAVCEGRMAGGMPAKGFFEKAAELGFDTTAPSRFVASQRAALSAAACPATSRE